MERLRKGKFLIVLSLFVFGVTFLLTNPYALIQFQEFQRDVAFERAHLSFGHIFKADHAGFRWLLDLVGATGIVNALFFSIGLFLVLFRK